MIVRVIVATITVAVAAATWRRPLLGGDVDAWVLFTTMCVTAALFAVDPRELGDLP